MKTALIAGSTGLIGNQLLQLLLESTHYDRVIALSRVDLPAHPKLVQVIGDFKNFKEESKSIIADDVFCCLGTTMAKARSKEKFREVDFDYPLLIATATHSMGAKQYLLVSALGANKKSAVFYNQVKGEIEDEITSCGFRTVHIFRPSLLLGPRTEQRSTEDSAKFFYKFFGFLIPQKYKAIESAKVAKAMIHFASLDKSGIFIHESMDLQQF
jgi:uncharacterized protein YbjT (DUF2867 family)